MTGCGGGVDFLTGKTYLLKLLMHQTIPLLQTLLHQLSLFQNHLLLLVSIICYMIFLGFSFSSGFLSSLTPSVIISSDFNVHVYTDSNSNLTFIALNHH